MIAVIDNLGSRDITALEKEAKAYFLNQTNGYRIEAASPPLMFAHIGERNMKNMVWVLNIILKIQQIYLPLSKFQFYSFFLLIDLEKIG